MNSCMRGLIANAMAGLALLGATAGQAEELTPVTLGTTWYAQAEHGGYYQAVAEGIYEKYGLDVEIKMGGPQVNNTQLLMAGQVDFAMGYSLKTLNAVKEGLPMVTVAAFFQKDPQSLVVHQGQGFDSLEDLKGHPIKVPTAGRVAYWPWLRAKYGFTDDQLRPYDYSFGPFKADKQAVQQGYITNDGYFLEQAEIDAKSIHLAEYGWRPYAATLDTQKRTVEERPEMVRKFIKASVEGWKRYFENPAPGNALIKRDNPEQTDELLAYSHDAMQKYGILTSGAASEGQIGIMTAERWRRFYEDMVAAGTLPEGLDYESGYTLEFIGEIYPEAVAAAD